MHAALLSFLAYFLTPAGVVVMGILDGSVVFFLPLGIDFVAIILTARDPHLFWMYALLATIGSVIGAAGTYWIGRQVGEKELWRFVGHRQLRRVKAQVDRGVFVVVALAAVPPPFPFTAFVTGAGALDMNPRTFFPLFTLARLVRFGLETALASYYGRHVLRWMRTPMFQAVVGAIIVLAVVGTIVSAALLWRSTKAATRDTAA